MRNAAKDLILSHQFGITKNHLTTDQVHRITHVIEGSREERKLYSAAFHHVAQAFDKVWHEGLKEKFYPESIQKYLHIR